ncbi:MAG: hypothetical protein ACHQDB_00895 [Steroidobacterales bacterium]
MGNTADNHWRIPGSEQREPARRDQVLKAVTLALVTGHGAGSDAKQCDGFNPYDSRLGSNQRDVWGGRRRA